MEWKLAEAKNRFSEVINKVMLEGPQRVVRRDKAFIIIEEAYYQQLIGQKPSFKDYLLHGESLVGLDLTRGSSPMRDTAL